MASRPFATINVALEMEEEPPDLIGGNVKVSSTPEISQFPELTGGLSHHGGVSAIMTRSTRTICFTHLLSDSRRFH